MPGQESAQPAVEVARRERRRDFRRPDDDHRLAARRSGVAVMLSQGAEARASDFLVPLGQLARDCGAALTEDLGHVGKRGGEARRPLEEDQRGGEMRPIRQGASPRRRTRRQKPGKEKDVGREARQDQRGQRRRRARRRGHRQVLGERGAHQLEAGVGDQRGAGIADQRQCLAAAQRLEDGGADAIGVVVVIGVERLVDAEAGQETCGHPGVLAQDAVDAAQHPERPQTYVAKIADRGGDEMQARR